MQDRSRTSHYFNAASHGVPETRVYNSMAAYLRSEAELGPDRAALRWAESLSNAKRGAASLLQPPEDQIGITSTTTAAWLAIVSKLNLAGKRVLVTEHEWGDFYGALSSRSDVTIEVLPLLDFDNPDLSSWADCIDEDVAAIFVPMVTSIAGHRYPVEAIGALPRPTETKLIVDAAQALGQTSIEVAALNCDALVSTCRKWLRGPRQTALFWVNDRWQPDGTSLTAGDFEPADKNAALVIGLGVAIAHYLEQPQELTERKLIHRADILRSWAREREIPIFGGGSARSAIVSLEICEAKISEIEAKISDQGFVVKIPTIATAEPLQSARSNLKRVLRLSPHVYTSETDIGRLTDLLSTVIR